MVRVSPHLLRANHFRTYADKLETAVGGGHRLVFAAPPQHGKTQVTLHGLAQLIIRHPDKRHAYVTYSQTRARSVARTVRRILAAAGIVVSGTLDMMVLPGGGQSGIKHRRHGPRPGTIGIICPSAPRQPP